jgi:hypothetical protein
VRLIRSKGVGVYFVTQNPLDIPDMVLSQLGNRVQHALRAYTPREQKAVKTAAETFRPNPEFKTEVVITELGVGEALVSTLEIKGVPSVVERTLMRPPSSRLGPITDAERQEIMAMSPVSGQYDETVDRESAYEILLKQAEARSRGEAPVPTQPDGAPRSGTGFQLPDFGNGGGRPQPQQRAPAPRRTGNRQTVTEAAIKSVTRSVANTLGREIVRGILGSLKKIR